MFKDDIEMEGVTVFEGDLTNFEDLARAMEASGCNAVLIATGTRAAMDPLGPFTVDYNGTLNAIAMAKKIRAEHVVLVTSIGVDDILFPLNLFWGVLFWKKRAEEALQVRIEAPPFHPFLLSQSLSLYAFVSRFG